MQIYCELNEDFKGMCAFLNYWAQMRGLLGEVINISKIACIN